MQTNSLFPPYLPTVIGTVVAICFVWHIWTLKRKLKTNTFVRKSRDGDYIYYFVIFSRPDSISVSARSESTLDKHSSSLQWFQKKYNSQKRFCINITENSIYAKITTRPNKLHQ